MGTSRGLVTVVGRIAPLGAPRRTLTQPTAQIEAAAVSNAIRLRTIRRDLSGFVQEVCPGGVGPPIDRGQESSFEVERADRSRAG